MTTEVPIERWTIVVISTDVDKHMMFKLAGDTTITEVKRLWEGDCNLPRGSMMSRCDGSILHDHQQISEVEEVIPGSRMVNVLVAETITLRVEQYKSQIKDVRRMAVGLHETPEEIHDQIRDVFGLHHDIPFRLRTHAAILNYSLTFENQPIAANDVLLVDFGYQIDIIDDWSSTLNICLMFSSDRAADLVSEDRSPQRFLLDGMELDLSGDLIDALPLKYRRMSRVIVQHQRRRSITLMMNSVLKQRLVWPTDLVGELIADHRSPKSDLYYEGERLPFNVTFKELNLPEHTVIHGIKRVSVKLSNGKYRIIRVPDITTAADIKAAVSAAEGTTQFSLRFGGRLLLDSDFIPGLEGRSIEVERPGDTVRVCLPDRCVKFKSEQRVMCFMELMSKVAETGQLDLVGLVDRQLQCQGCGRRLTMAEQDFQTIPADCCRVRSLRLDIAPPKKRDCETQGPCVDGGKKIHRKTLGVRPRQIEKRMQASPKCYEEGTQASRPRSRGVAQQTVDCRQQRKTAEVLIQHPPQKSRPFYVHNLHRLARENDPFKVNLFLGDEPTAGQVRKALAEHLKILPATIELRRVVGRCHCNDEEVFEVFDDRHGNWGFAEPSGKWKPYGDVNWIYVYPEDGDLFPLAAGWRNCVSVSPS